MRTLSRAAMAALVLFLCLAATASALDDHEVKASVADLAWMTGSWSGALGPNTLEEHWVEPKGGTISALVRMTTAESTPTMELIVIEQTGDTLVLRLQQWNPGWQSRTDGPTKFRLSAIGERTVSWEAEGDAPITSLTYSRPADDEFVIDVGTPGGGLKIPLKAVD